MYTLPTEPIGIGQVLDKAFQLTKATFARVWWLALLAGLANVMASAYQFSKAGRSVEAVLMYQGDATFWVLYVCGILISMLCWSVIFLRQHGAANGQPPGGELGVALRRLPIFVITAILYGIAVGVGTLLLVIPGVIVAVSLILFQLLVLIENKGPFASLNGSHKLVWGSWWRTLGTLLLAAIIVMVLYFMIGFAVAIVAAIVTGNDPFLTGLVTALLLMTSLEILVVPFFAALELSIYYDLKLRRQGGDLAARVGALAT